MSLLGRRSRSDRVTLHSASLLEALYIAAVAATAALGDTRSTALLLVVVLLTLPCGVAALVMVYLVYGLAVGSINGLGGHVMTGNGWSPAWFVVLDEVLVTVIFVAAAVGNLFLARLVRPRKSGRGRSAMPGRHRLRTRSLRRAPPHQGGR